jgi:hypothetical protein
LLLLLLVVEVGVVLAIVVDTLHNYIAYMPDKNTNIILLKQLNTTWSAGRTSEEWAAAQVKTHIKDEWNIQGDFLMAVPRHGLSVMCDHCIGCRLS